MIESPMTEKVFSTAKKAFTLAEVLITLGIIGVVAAMTIPSLMNKTQDKEFRTQMLKDYSVLNSAFEQVKEENGGEIQTALSGCAGDGADNACLKNAFKPYLKYIKECDRNDGTNLNVCFPAKAGVKTLDGAAAADFFLNSDDTSSLVLSDGSSVAFFLDDANCKNNYSPDYSNRCGWFSIDTNGPAKKPNTWGKDMYIFFLYDNSIKPSRGGHTMESVSDDCGTGTNKGYTCSSKYIAEKN